MLLLREATFKRLAIFSDSKFTLTVFRAFSIFQDGGTTLPKSRAKQRNDFFKVYNKGDRIH